MSPLAISTQPPARTSDDRAALRRAAQGFEALFVRRMLEAARAGGGDALFGNTGTEQFTAIRDAHLADVAAARGAFGIAAAIEAQLAARTGGEDV